MISLIVALDEITLNNDDLPKIVGAIRMLRFVASVTLNNEPQFSVSRTVELGKIKNFYHLMGEIEDGLIGAAMQKANGNKSEAARLLGMKRTSLTERLKKVHGTPVTPEPDRRPTLRELRKRGVVI